MSDIGVIGLGVMGKSLAKNFMSKNYRVSGYDFDQNKVNNLSQEKNFEGYNNLDDFLKSLDTPKRVLIMVPAGDPVDQVIDSIKLKLDKGSIIIEAGNSYFMDTERRSTELEKMGLNYFGVGVSGGEKGALYGPSIMPSGNKEAYKSIEKMLNDIAAKYEGEPACTYIGPKGSGHYVKMVHNGIEYADMQLLAETYLILKKAGYSNLKISNIFKDWNKTDVKSYLLEISSKILKEKDEISGKSMIDVVLDVAKNKGTGKWTSIESLKQDVNASMLTLSFTARLMSDSPLRKSLDFKNDKTIENIDLEALRKAYSTSKILAFSQGFNMYLDASKRFNYQLDLRAIASIFRAGCIIQSSLLQKIMDNYEENKNIIEFTAFKKQIQEDSHYLRTCVIKGLEAKIPLPAYTSALVYLDQIGCDVIGANMIQAQRDFFGAHTFVRNDTNETVHHNWE